MRLDADEVATTYPLVRYHGGKGRESLRRWILGHFPLHEIYIEPFAGAASVFFAKPRSRIEVLNDLNGRSVNLFRVLQDPGAFSRLVRLLRYTPYSIEEFLKAREVSPDAVEDARRFLVLGWQGHGSTATAGNKLTGWRRGVDPANRYRNAAKDWTRVIRGIHNFAARLQGVYLDRVDALEVVRRWDAPDALFYVDPPYPKETRTAGARAYTHETSDDLHVRLAEALRAVKGAVIISSYPSDLYDSLFEGWFKAARATHADAGAKRVEVIYCNRVPGGRLF